MSDTLFEPAPPVLVPVLDTEARYPVRHVYAVARNYADHAREMGAAPEREPPFFFAKAAHSVAPAELAADGVWEVTVPYPTATGDLHHEVELVAALGAGARVVGYAVGIDLTRRDLQAQAKAAGRPWDMAKSFAGAAPLGPIQPWPVEEASPSGSIRLSVDGGTRQSGTVSDMIWAVDEILSHLAHYDALEAGDLVFTGTPAGVGAVEPGQVLLAEIEGLPPLRVRISGRKGA